MSESWQIRYKTCQQWTISRLMQLCLVKLSGNAYSSQLHSCYMTSTLHPCDFKDGNLWDFLGEPAAEEPLSGGHERFCQTFAWSPQKCASLTSHSCQLQGNRLPRKLVALVATPPLTLQLRNRNLFVDSSGCLFQGSTWQTASGQNTFTEPEATYSFHHFPAGRRLGPTLGFPPTTNCWDPLAQGVEGLHLSLAGGLGRLHQTSNKTPYHGLKAFPASSQACLEYLGVS